MRSEEVRLERLPRLLAPRFFRSSAGFWKLLRQAGEQANRPRGARVIYTGAASGGGAREDFAPTLGLYGRVRYVSSPQPNPVLHVVSSRRQLEASAAAPSGSTHCQTPGPCGCPAQRRATVPLVINQPSTASRRRHRKQWETPQGSASGPALHHGTASAASTSTASWTAWEPAALYQGLWTT